MSRTGRAGTATRAACGGPRPPDLRAELSAPRPHPRAAAARLAAARLLTLAATPAAGPAMTGREPRLPGESGRKPARPTSQTMQRLVRTVALAALLVALPAGSPLAPLTARGASAPAAGAAPAAAGVPAAVAAGRPAVGAWTSGACPDGRGVTVVVDFNQLGGATWVRCARLEAGSGIDALRAAGAAVTGVLRYGDAFVCRLAGRPSATQALAVQGIPGYREQCVDTPPAQAYWSYWHARDDGPWEYSTLGARARQVRAGGFEGWSFALNTTAARPPDVAAVRPPAPPPATSAGPATRPRDTGAGPTAAGPRAGSGRPTASRGTPGPSPAPASTPTGTVTGPGTASPGSTPASTAAPARSPDANPAAGPTPGGEARGIPAGVLAGAGLAAFLATAAAGTGWVRRRDARPR